MRRLKRHGDQSAVKAGKIDHYPCVTILAQDTDASPALEPLSDKVPGSVLNIDVDLRKLFRFPGTILVKQDLIVGSP
jgi:hypothetical protein